jgi:serine/threonine protein phosphatase PrpC
VAAILDAAVVDANWRLGARSETGYVRSSNEDRMGWTRTPWGNAYVVSDGMGGHLGGALAAEITVRTLRDRLAAIAAGPQRPSGVFEEAVREAFAAANEAVRLRRDSDDPHTCEMGATAVALVTAGASVLVGHVGDSRAYLWGRRAGLRRLTRDHTRTQTRLDAGLITLEEAAADPEASVLARAIGHRPAVQADLSAWATLVPGDMVLLCTDGLCGYVSEDEIDAVLRAGKEPQALADRLVEDALRKGGEDNVTVQLVLFCGSDPGGAGASGLARRLGRPVAGVGAVILVSAATAGLVTAHLVAQVDGRLTALSLRVEAIGQALQSQQARLAAADAPAMAPVAAPAAPSTPPTPSTPPAPPAPSTPPTPSTPTPAATARASVGPHAPKHPAVAQPHPAAAPASDSASP